MIDQETYEDLCRMFLSSTVVTIVKKYFSCYESFICAAQEKFAALNGHKIPENILAELYAFYDYLKDYQPEVEEQWDIGEEDYMDEEDYIDEKEPITEEEYLKFEIEKRLRQQEAHRQLVQKWRGENEKRKRECEARKQKELELIESAKQDVRLILRNAKVPLPIEDIVDKYNDLHPESPIDKSIIKNCLCDTKAFINVGRKSLYALKTKSTQNIFKGSLYDAVSKVLHSQSKPFLIDDLVAGVLKFRPDSNQKSVRSIITSMLKSHRIFLFNDKYIGLDTIKYHKSFKKTRYEARQTFEEKLQKIKMFVAENNRLPFTNGPLSETSLAVWFNRTTQNTNLTTQQMVAFYNFRQEIEASGIPQNVEQFEFRQNCKEYKSRVMRTGKLISYHEDRMLYTWFKKSCERYSTFNDARKIYFDELIHFLLAFGYELNLG